MARLVIDFVLTILAVASAELQIRNSGIERIGRRDVGMVFFVEVRNVCQKPLALSIRMIQCCETVCADDIDCEHMRLIGGDMGIVNPHGLRNLTLIWPTLYLHNRLGECVVRILYAGKNNQTGELRHRIKFDTTVSRHVPPILEGYYEPFNVKTCATVDLDALDSCRPVNCHIKYSGKRNFYNRKLQRCQVVPICIADNGKELPDVVYLPASNTCRDLENAVNEVEIRALTRGVAQPAWKTEPAPHIANMYCHHGYADNTTGFCICEDGWTSYPLDNVEPTTEYIHMCNVQLYHFPRLHDRPVKLLLIVIGSLLGVLVVIFCCAMVFGTRELVPPGGTVERGQQVEESSWLDSSTKSLTSCSNRTARSDTVKCFKERR